MRSLIAAALFLIAGSVHAADVDVASKIDAVTVFPSGAEIVRLTALKLEKGEHVLIFNDIPASAAPNSIYVEGRATGAALEIGSVDTRRLFVPHSDEAASVSERRRLEEEVERLQDQRAVLEGQTLAANTQGNLLSNLAELPKRPVPAGAGAASEDWARVLNLIATGTAEAVRARQAAQVKMRELNRKIADLKKQLVSIAPKRERRTEVKVHVTAADALSADLTLRYQVPNASGTALYDARLDTGGKIKNPSLDLTRRASIKQRTGEDWENVKLVLSTTRPTAGAAAPELFPVTVNYVPEPKPEAPEPVADAAPAPPAEYARRRTAGRMKEEERAGGLAGTMSMSEPQEAVERDAVTVAAPFQALFEVPGRLSIPHTGEAKRVQLSHEVTEPTLAVRTVPKDDANAYLYAKMVLPKGSPVLPGTVALFRDGTFVGNGLLPVLSPGEEHELGFGVDDSVRVRYAVVEDKRGQAGLISSTKTDTRNFRVTVTNLHERPVTLTMFDQIPASQNQDIKVERTGEAPSIENFEDKSGVLVWNAELAAQEEKVFEYGYRVSWPAAKSVEYSR